MSITKPTYKNIFFVVLLIGFVVIAGVYAIVPFIKKQNFIRFLNQTAQLPELHGSRLVVSARYSGTEKDLVSFNADARIHPGSNFKLFTAAASLQYLTPEFTFKTQLFRMKGKRGLKHLYIKGFGDPSLRREDITKIAASVKPFGKISGNIYYDDSYFEGEKFGPGWGHDWFDQYFAVPITGLQINDNLLEIRGLTSEKTNKFEITTAPLEGVSVIDRRVEYETPEQLKKMVTASQDSSGRVALFGDTLRELPFHTSAVMRDPSLMTALVLKQELVKAGLIDRNVDVLPFTFENPGELIFEHHSPPLRELITRMLKFSKNNFAETLVRTLGKEISGIGSQQSGVELLREFFDEIGIESYEISALDGSGLAPGTRVSGSAILKLFAYVNTQPWKDIFWDALPLSQVDGTLKYRFENAGLKNTVLAKTGTHEFSSSLSGKILRSSRDILFSVHVYNHQYSTEESVQRIVPIIDKIVALLDKQF